MELDQIHQLENYTETLRVVTDRLRERSEVMEGLCEATQEAETDQDEVENTLQELTSEFGRTARKFVALIEMYEQIREVMDLQETRLAGLSDELDQLMDGCFEDSRQMLEVVTRIQHELSADSDLWRVVSQGKRQARQVRSSIEDFTMSRQLKRRLPADREPEEPQETTLEEQADDIQQQVQEIQDMVEELIQNG